MDRYTLYVPNFLPFKEYFVPEKNQACSGCGLSLAVRQAYKALEKKIEKALWQMPVERGPFNGIQMTTSAKKGEVSLLKIKKTDADLFICFDNEAGGTLRDAVKKTMPDIAVAEGFGYVATACPSYPFDLYEKVKRGLASSGMAYIHILCPCPVGWEFEPELTVKIGRWAVETRAFPLYEASGGFYRMTVTIPKPRSLSEYIRAQKRFGNITERELEETVSLVEHNYKRLMDKLIDAL